MPPSGACVTSSKQQLKLCSEIQITVRVKKCPEIRKSNITKVPQNCQMFKLHNAFFTFDHIKWENESQEKVYKAAAYPFVEKALQGHSATILAYGPTGTGKSYTMGSLVSMKNNWQKSGLIQRCLKHIFEENKIEVSASFVEIYDGEFRDLLNMGAKLDRSLEFDPKIEGIKSLDEGLQLVNEALLIRQECQTSSSSSQSISSSQSHALLTLHLKIQDRGKFLESKLNLMDLAGSEILAQTEARQNVYCGKSHLDESLDALNKVIAGMSKKPDQILFQKNNTLISILADLFNERWSVSLIACISSDPVSDSRATFRTLRVAESVKTLQIRRRMGLTSDLLTNQLKPKIEKLPTVSSPQSLETEMLDRQDQEPVITPSIDRKIKNCTIVLTKFEVDEDGLESEENITPLNNNGIDTQNRKVPPTNIEVGYSAGTESTVSISGSPTQYADHETFEKTDLSTSQYNEHMKFLDDSFSMSPLEDIATAKPAKLHKMKEDNSDGECQSEFHGFEHPNELLQVSQLSHGSADEKQSILANNVSQLSISRVETVNPEYAGEKRGSLSLENVTTDHQFSEKREVFPSAPKSHMMKRMQAILTTDFSQPGPFQIDYQTPRKMIKLDKTNSLSMSKQVSGLQPEPEESRSEENDCENIENGKNELSDKQKAHNNNILRILNTSNVEQLLDLPRIGFKTAVSLYQYRLIHGEFNSLKSLENLPFWTDKLCKNFFAANNVFIE